MVDITLGNAYGYTTTGDENNPIYPDLQFDQSGNPQQLSGRDRAWALFKFTSVGEGIEYLTYVEARRLNGNTFLGFYIMVSLDGGTIDPIAYINQVISNVSPDALIGTPEPGSGSPTVNDTDAPNSNTTVDSMYTSFTYGWSIQWSSDDFAEIHYPDQISEIDLSGGDGTFNTQAEFVSLNASSPFVQNGTMSLSDPVSCLDAYSQRWINSGSAAVPSSHDLYPAVFEDSETRAGELYSSMPGSFQYVDCRVIVPGESMLLILSQSGTGAGQDFSSAYNYLIPLFQSITLPS
jgi:hypothetical protein